MPKQKINHAREHRIEMEAVVDAYGREERAMGWYYYLEGKLDVPFKARVQTSHSVSPLAIGEEVEVLGMAPEEVCESDMFVWVRWPKRNLAVPLSQLQPLTDDGATKEAVADWHYWVNQGYEF
jgi:Calcium binding